MKEKITFRINYPLEILTNYKKVNFLHKSKRKKIFKRNIFYSKYKQKNNNVFETRYKIYYLLAKKAIELINKDYPKLEILNISTFGSSLYAKEPNDFDFLVIVKGNSFLLKETTFVLEETKAKYKVGISIKGFHNLSQGIFDLDCKIPINQQNQIIDRTAISLFKRHIPIMGFDFVENKEIFKENILAQVSDLLKNTYNLYYLKKEKLELKDYERGKKILSRLYEAVSYLEILENNKEISKIRKEIYNYYENEEISFSKSKFIYDKFMSLYIKISKKTKQDIMEKITFEKDEKEFNQILEKTKKLLSKNKIGKFLPVMAKIVNSQGHTIAFTKRIKNSNKLETNSGPIHAEVCAIQKAISKGKTNWKDYTLYCSLEPCGVCTNMITKLGIKKVVYCLADPLLSYYGRKRKPYKKNNVLFYKHNSPELIKNFQIIYSGLYKKKISSNKTSNILEILLDKEIFENIEERLKKYWKCINLPYKWIPSILNMLKKNPHNEDIAIEKIRFKFPSIPNEHSLDYSKKLKEWRKIKVKNLAKRISKHLVGKIFADVGGRASDLTEQIILLNKEIESAFVTDVDFFSKESKSHKINFLIQPTPTKVPFKKNSINTAILSMVLHHLKSIDQINLIKNVISSLDIKGRIILIEDSYPEILPQNTPDKFLKLSHEKKMKILSFFDWFGNRLMRNRDNISLTYNYKTMEEWKKIMKKFGMKQIYSEFVKENPSSPDLFSPKGFMVFEKK